VKRRSAAEALPRHVWWSVAEAADALGISAHELRELGVVGWGPRYVRVGLARRYRPADVRAWASLGVRTAAEVRR
jgi:hypothetical protein